MTSLFQHGGNCLKSVAVLVFAALKFVFWSVVTDSFQGFGYLKEVVNLGYKEDKETKEMMKKFESEYILKGWILMMSLARTLILIFYTITHLFANQNTPDYKLITKQWPFILIMFICFDIEFNCHI